MAKADKGLDKELALDLLEQIPVGVMVLGSNGEVVWANPMLCSMVGMSPGDLKGLDPTAAKPGYIKELLSARQLVTIPSVEGSPERSLMCSSKSLNGAYEGACKVNFYMDASATVKIESVVGDLQQKVNELELTDQLTGLLNYRSLVRGLELMISCSRRYDNVLSVVSIEVTNLDELDKQFGDGSADKVIVATSQTLRDQLRWADMIGRVSVQGFFLVLPETTQANAAKLIEKLSSQLTTLDIEGNKAISDAVQISYGTAQWEKRDDIGTLLKRARESMTAVSDK